MTFHEEIIELENNFYYLNSQNYVAKSVTTTHIYRFFPRY